MLAGVDRGVKHKFVGGNFQIVGFPAPRAAGQAMVETPFTLTDFQGRSAETRRDLLGGLDCRRYVALGQR